MTLISEMGLAALCLSFFAALIMGGFGLLSCRVQHPAHLQLVQRITWFCGGLIALSFLALVAAYVLSDFSVANVYENSHTAKPLLYKITGTWGNHEGSMLLWVGILALFACAYAASPARSPHEQAAALGVLGVSIAGFVLFILLTSNPFARVTPLPLEGQDLNPLLQDIGLAIHPPLLYIGYVGFAVVFALAVAALATRQPVDSLWARQVRPWCLLAWAFLTAGIGLGSWWAYRELGWGGWWFWDPVENVSLLPWLSGTALLHCLLIMAKRPMLQNWTLLLAIFTFTFSLLGTFLVRSGLLTSVHSFASDPTRGLYILIFVTAIIGGSLWLYASRFPRPAEPDFVPLSREGGIMLNNLLLITLCATLLLGIIYPLLLQVFDLPSVSVGAPFYNTVVVPVTLPLLLAAGITPLLAWRQSGWRASRRLLRHALVAMVLIAAAAALLFAQDVPALFEMPMALLMALAGAWMMAATYAYGKKQYNASAGRITTPVAGMLLAHMGVAIFALAASFSSAGRVESEQRITVGQSLTMAGYEVELAALDKSPRQNYSSKLATVHLTSLDGRVSHTLHPETRFYPSRGMETAESSIRGNLQRDVYTAIATAGNISDSKGEADTLILRVYIIPAMWWLWAGFIMASAGGGIAAFGYFRNTYQK